MSVHTLMIGGESFMFAEGQLVPLNCDRPDGDALDINELMAGERGDSGVVKGLITDWLFRICPSLTVAQMRTVADWVLG